MTLSYHAQFERAERFAKLEETLGFTNIAMEAIDPKRNTKLCVTSSGILIVKDVKTDMVVTAYMISVKELISISRKAGKKQVPPKLMKRVEKNMVRHIDLYRI